MRTSHHEIFRTNPLTTLNSLPTASILFGFFLFEELLNIYMFKNNFGIAQLNLEPYFLVHFLLLNSASWEWVNRGRGGDVRGRWENVNKKEHVVTFHSLLFSQHEVPPPILVGGGGHLEAVPLLLLIKEPIYSAGRG